MQEPEKILKRCLHGRRREEKHRIGTDAEDSAQCVLVGGTIAHSMGFINDGEIDCRLEIFEKPYDLWMPCSLVRDYPPKRLWFAIPFQLLRHAAKIPNAHHVELLVKATTQLLSPFRSQACRNNNENPLQIVART